MTGLASPDDPEDLWLAADVVDVPQHRMLMQGDLIAAESRLVCIVPVRCAEDRSFTTRKSWHPYEITT